MVFSYKPLNVRCQAPTTQQATTSTIAKKPNAAPKPTTRPLLQFGPPQLKSCTIRSTSQAIWAPKNESYGPFAPIVRITRDIVGQKKFNKFRGNAIAAHSQVIKTFCVNIGASQKTASQVIRLAKKNGHTLGFLA